MYQRGRRKNILVNELKKKYSGQQKNQDLQEEGVRGNISKGVLGKDSDSFLGMNRVNKVVKEKGYEE